MSTETDVKTEEKNRKASQLGATTWKVTLKRVLNAFAKWRTRLFTNFIGFHTLFGRSPSANRRFENCRRLVRNLLSDCLEVVVSGKN